MSVETDPRIGSKLLGYGIEELIGQGGMGVVYCAYDPRLKRKVALKLVVPELAEDGRFRERFLRESELAAALEHPNVVPIHDAGEVDGQLYLAMRYVEGSDLRTLLREEGALEPGRALAVCAQVADALDAAHARGLVHRDVKPSNVLLDRNDYVYLADFGLSRRLTEPGTQLSDARSLGTPAYVAPEQIEGAPVDGRADVYSLGCLLYECLTGEAPFADRSRLAVVWAHLEQEPPRASDRNRALPEAIDAVIRKAMAKDPSERYGSCSELVSAAREALGLRAAVGTRDRKPVALAAGALVLALMAAVLAFILTRGGESASSGLVVREDTLVRIDPEKDEVTAVTDVGAEPSAVAVAGGTVWVYNVADRTVSEIDSSTNAVQRTARISTDPLETAFWVGPLIAADGSGAWVVGGRARLDGVLTRFRSGSGEKREYPLSYDLWAVAVGEGAVWVVARDARRSTVLRVDPKTGAVVARVPLPARINIDGIAVGEGAVWVTDAWKAMLFRIDPRSSAVTGTVDLGTLSALPAVGLGSVWMWVSDDEGKVLRIHPRTLNVTKATLSAPNRDFTLVISDHYRSIWWNDVPEGTLVRFDPRTGKILSTLRVTPPQEGEDDRLVSLAMAAGAGGVWVTVCRCWGY